MANFKNAFDITIKSEGLYNSGVGEKETYKGIDRGANPNWPGWKFIDSYKPLSVGAMNLKLSLDSKLQADIVNFYLSGYWNPFKLSQIVDQQIANNIFDEATNQGPGIAPKHLQMACNNVIQHVGAKVSLLTVDGIIGLKTLNIVNALEAELVYNEINTLRRDRYLDTVAKNPSMKQWLKVWLQRLTPYNHSLVI